MEAGYGFSGCNEGSRLGCKVVHWQNDWHKFKRVFKAAGRLNGIAEALRYGEMLACQSKNLKNEVDDGPDELQTKALGQFPKLAALLTSAISNSEGAQQSIVMDELENDEDGITAWMKLIIHFEQSTQEVRVENLLHQWENEVLLANEHPDQLYGRLYLMKTRLEKLGKNMSEANPTRRFVLAIEKEENNKYRDVITFYRGQMIIGNTCPVASLREFLSYVYANKIDRATKPAMKGLASITGCSNCGKVGHSERECWSKRPRNKKNTEKGQRTHSQTWSVLGMRSDRPPEKELP